MMVAVVVVVDHLEQATSSLFSPLSWESSPQESLLYTERATAHPSQRTIKSPRHPNPQRVRTRTRCAVPRRCRCRRRSFVSPRL